MNHLGRRLKALSLTGMRKRWAMVEVLGAPSSARWQQMGVRGAPRSTPRPRTLEQDAEGAPAESAKGPPHTEAD